jgi:6-phosphogluconolactonase
MQGRQSFSRRGRVLVAFGLALAVLTATAASANAAPPMLKPGAVFTQSNTAPLNRVIAYNRGADGQLTKAGDFPTGGSGRPAGNPPPFSGFPVIDSMGSVNLSDDGDNNSCLFVVNAGTNAGPNGSVSSFRVRPDGLQLADQKDSGGPRPASLSSTTRGPGKQIMYVLNSDNTSASIRGFYVSGQCTLTQIPGSDRPLPSQDSVPATVRFDEHGRFLAVSERYAPGPPLPVGGNGDVVVYRVDSSGVTTTQTVNPMDAAHRTPYGLDYNSKSDILSVTHEQIDPTFPASVAQSKVATYRQGDDGTLVRLDSELSPGAACWNLFTDNSKFLFVTNPAGGTGPTPPFTGTGGVRSYRVDRDGQMTFVNAQNTQYEAIDNALSHNDQFLYVLSATVLTSPPLPPSSAIDTYAIDQQTGAITPIDRDQVPNGNSTSGLAAW